MVLDQEHFPVDTTVRTVVGVTHTQYSDLVLDQDISCSNSLCNVDVLRLNSIQHIVVSPTYQCIPVLLETSALYHIHIYQKQEQVLLVVSQLQVKHIPTTQVQTINRNH